MTEFQLGLFAIGALAIIGVLVYNKLQERAAQRSAQRAFGAQHADVLLDEEAPRREPTLQPVARETERDAGTNSDALPDERLDYVIELSSREPLAPAVFLEHWVALERRFGWRVRASCGNGATGWRRVEHGDPASYAGYRAALQLVSRAGVISDAELIEFRSEVETIAAKLGASTTAPEMKHALEAARELDRFCADADIQVVFRVVAPDGTSFLRPQVEAATSAAGMDAGADGIHIKRDHEGRALYALSVQVDDQQGMRSITVALDVPRVAEVRRTYESMVRFARQLAGTLGGSLVDDNGNVLDERALAAIGAELESVRRALQARGVEPGGPLAARLFA